MQHPPASDYPAANMQVTWAAVFATRGPMQEMFHLRWTALEAAWWVVVQEEAGVVTAEIARLMY
jgi:hypothetical protein